MPKQIIIALDDDLHRRLVHLKVEAGRNWNDLATLAFTEYAANHAPQ